MTDVLLLGTEVTIRARCCSVFRTNFDLLTTVFMLTCCTRSLGACLRLLTRRRLWRLSSAPPSVPLSYSRFLLSAARTRHEVTRVQEPATSTHVVVSSPFCIRLPMTATTEVSVPDRALVSLQAVDLSTSFFSCASPLSPVRVGRIHAG